HRSVFMLSDFVPLPSHSILFSFFFLLLPPPPRSTLFPYTTLFRSLSRHSGTLAAGLGSFPLAAGHYRSATVSRAASHRNSEFGRSEEHTSELQSLRHLVCRLLLEKKKKNNNRKQLITTNLIITPQV